MYDLYLLHDYFRKVCEKGKKSFKFYKKLLIATFITCRQSKSIVKQLPLSLNLKKKEHLFNTKIKERNIFTVQKKTKTSREK